ncbi:MAG TPA: DUF4339 domain-containing protein [Candidatus Limnocylindrales bacterium]|nr:DUF4339 domain-containing protein [Candidatus Limnocylindrales bacterium]
MSDTQTQWYVRKNGVVHGPASEAQLRSLIDAGRIRIQEEASQSTQGPWRPLSEYAEFAAVRPISELFGDSGTAAAVAPAAAVAAAPGAQPMAAAPQAQAVVRPPAAESIAARPAASASAPAAAAAVSVGRLSETDRIVFVDELTKEMRKKVEDRAYPAAFIVGGVAFFAIAKLSMAVALIVGLVAAGIAFSVVKSIFETKYVASIAEYSDEMLVTRLNEAKADRRAARTRSAIGWAVIAIIGVILLIAWIAARVQMQH